jgi:tRNA threonylcarbamoyladenosine biosynthesis protein TsaB
VRLLAFDTALGACSVACCDDDRTMAARREPMAVGQAERLVPMIALAMHEAGWSWSEVELLAVTLGPGTFTGIRVGLAAARGLALATGRPCLGVSTPEAMAAAVGAGRALLCVVLGRQGTRYAQPFAASGAPLGPVQAARAVDLEALRPDAAVLVDDPDLVDGPAVAAAALRRLRAGAAPVPGTALRPLYLRDADARPDAGRPLVGGPGAVSG